MNKGHEFLGIYGETRREAFHGWVTRVRRHIAWRLIKPELKAYLEITSESWSHPRSFSTISQFDRWISGPSSWSREDWWRDNENLD